VKFLDPAQIRYQRRTSWTAFRIFRKISAFAQAKGFFRRERLKVRGLPFFGAGGRGRPFGHQSLIARASWAFAFRVR